MLSSTLLSANNPGKVKTHFGYVAELAGDTVMVWDIHQAIEKDGKLHTVKDEKMSWEAEWDFVTHTISVAEMNFPTDLIPLLEQTFGDQLKKLEPVRQEVLFKGGCSVCGVKEVNFPHQAIRDGYGNIIAGSPPEKVRWECSICNRLVCRNCALTVDDLGREIWHNTYCSQACRAAAPADLLDEDEQNRMT
jgi:hypothetical protein